MSEPFLGEIRLFANGYAPRNWAFCEGQILPINSNQALYSLLGKVYGGDGVTTFALPDYRGRVPIHTTSSVPIGTSAGEATHTLTINEIPVHYHQVSASEKDPSVASPRGNVWSQSPNSYDQLTNQVTMNPGSLASSGGSQPHNNMQPYLALNYAIAVQGIYPSRN